MDAQLERDREMKRLAKHAALNAPVDHNARLRAKYSGNYASNAMKHYEEKYGKNPGKFLFTQSNNAKETRTQQDEELSDLFDTVIMEIEERQQFLEEMTKSGHNKEVETRMKKEIVDRIGELQKIKELMNKNEGGK